MLHAAVVPERDAAGSPVMAMAEGRVLRQRAEPLEQVLEQVEQVLEQVLGEQGLAR